MEKQQNVAKSRFVHLHNHTHYSLLDGLQKVPQMLDRVKELGMDTVAITDHGTLSGAIEFYHEAKKRDIKPVIGLEAYVAPRGHKDKAGRQDMQPYHLILIAYNNTGYHNLMKLVTIAQLEGFYVKPRIDRVLLEQYHEGLIALSACAGGEVASHIMDGNMAEAEAVVRWYESCFGQGNYYLELQDHEDQWDIQKKINNGKIELAKKTAVPMVVTADSHYSGHGDREAHEVLLCVQTGKTLDDTNRMKMDMDLFVSDPAEITQRWKHMPEVLENTAKIGDRASWELELGKILIPTFETPNGETERDYLHQLCWQGAMWRYGNIPKEDLMHFTAAKARAALPGAVTARIEYELSVIKGMGYEGYFLIVADFINWGKNQGIVFGPGRGSAAGSIIAYCMNITDLDPLKYDLLFERFLNPDRVSMPDIDIDIMAERRGEVIDYVTEKYGQDHVAQIITFGTMAARNAVRDTGRVLGYPYAEVDAIAKLIPQPVQGRHIPLANSIQEDPELSREYQSNLRAKKLIDLAIQLEGTIRSNGVHAAGVVITPEPISNYTPLQRAQKGGNSTQYSMNPIEELGLLKMDFLGLSNLDTINNALRIVRKVYAQNIDISLLPLDDQLTFKLLAKGDTTGVFQLESAGMKRYLKELKPNHFTDLIAMVALYRPGPMAELPRYIEGKNDESKVIYPHELLKDIFKETFGVMVYQEQVIAMLQLIAGYTPGQADLVRKAIGKKKRDIMEAEYPKFIAGCEKKSVAKEDANRLWEMIQPFADYSFNKSHAACYALIAYQTAFLKAHYPDAFMAALLTSDYENIDRIAIEVAECQRMGIEVLPPDINESFKEFAVVKGQNKIRFGLWAVKNLGGGAIDSLLKTREADGPFATVEDFAKRVNARECNKKGWESLIKSGAMDRLDDRSTLLHNLDLITGYAAKAQKNALSGQIDIFGSMGVEENLPGLRLDAPSVLVSNREQLAWEKELLGLYLSKHPLDEYQDLLNDQATAISLITKAMDGNTVTVGGIVTTMRKIITKNGGNMAFVGLEDKSGTLELIAFTKAYEKYVARLQPDSVILVTGKVNTKDREGKAGGEIKIMVDKVDVIDYDNALAHVGTKPAQVSPVDQIAATAPREPVASLALTLPRDADAMVLMQLKTLLAQYPGASEVFIVMQEPATRIKLPFKVDFTPDLYDRLQKLLGEEAVARV